MNIKKHLKPPPSLPTINFQVRKLMLVSRFQVPGTQDPAVKIHELDRCKASSKSMRSEVIPLMGPGAGGAKVWTV